MTLCASPKATQRNVVFLSYDGLTDPLGQSQILPYLAGLADSRTAVTVLSFEKPAALAAGRETVQAQIAGRNLSWVHLPYSNRPAVLSGLLNASRMRRLALKLHRRRPFDIVHCRSYLPMLAGRALQRAGAKLVFDMRGFWADERAAGGGWPLSHPLYRAIYRFFKHKERQFLRQADHVVCLTHAAKREMVTWPGCGDLASKTSVIPCCVDVDLFDPAKASAQAKAQDRARLGIAENDRVLTFLGSLGPLTETHAMLAFFKAWLARTPNSRFLFVTPSDPGPVREAARNLGLTDERILFVSAKRAEVPAYLSLSDIGVFFVRPAFFRIAMSPTKQAEFMAMGVPVVCNGGVGDTDEIIRGPGAGVVIDCLEGSAFHRALDALETARFDPLAIRAGALTRYQLQDGVRAYRSIYDALSTTSTAS